jgi:hypothetical protein
VKKSILIIALLGSWISLIVLVGAYYMMLGQYCEATFGSLADGCVTKNMRTFGVMALVMFASTAALSFVALRRHKKD